MVEIQSTEQVFLLDGNWAIEERIDYVCGRTSYKVYNVTSSYNLGLTDRTHVQCKNLIENKERIKEILERFERKRNQEIILKKDMKFFIKIKRASIKPNPDAGRTSFPVAGRDTTEIERYVCTGKTLVRQRVSDGFVCEEEESSCPANISDKQYKDLMAGKISEIVTQQNTTRDVSMIHTLTPASSHLFEYEDILVECCECYKKFSYKELEADETCGDAWSNQICPKCGAWDCCELEFESLDCALKDV